MNGPAEDPPATHPQRCRPAAAEPPAAAMPATLVGGFGHTQFSRESRPSALRQLITFMQWHLSSHSCAGTPQTCHSLSGSPRTNPRCQVTEHGTVFQGLLKAHRSTSSTYTRALSALPYASSRGLVSTSGRINSPTHVCIHILILWRRTRSLCVVHLDQRDQRALESRYSHHCWAYSGGRRAQGESASFPKALYAQLAYPPCAGPRGASWHESHTRVLTQNPRTFSLSDESAGRDAPTLRARARAGAILATQSERSSSRAFRASREGHESCLFRNAAEVWESATCGERERGTHRAGGPQLPYRARLCALLLLSGIWILRFKRRAWGKHM
ncbi:hypothetical protein BV25DRAFT_1501418 [Artomyces pyxidatus]|uniref:Uncharacterized protein n=1 Tax=Artomyces pyxidatus TaxID=48021 RepID=A0ACB8TCE2_9AGAM|nr:hypothetical protein BV25DRAFT_1501418 [Artomyces pyxidatus]